MSQSFPSASAHALFITQRWQQYEGEAKANFLRIVAIGVFYAIHLFNYLSSRGWFPHLSFLQLSGGVEQSRQFHVSVTLVAVAWVMLAVGVLFCLSRQVFPQWFSYFTTAADIVLLTTILYLAAGPRSPLVVGYFLVIVLAAARFHLRLVQLATGGAIVGYVCLLGCAKWPKTFGGTMMTVPRYHQLIMVAALALAGVMLGQFVRRAHRMSEEYAGRISRAVKEPS